MKLSVVIPCFNEADRLRATLEDILAWCRIHTPTTEIIVVDDGSTDRTVELVERLMRDMPEVRLVRLARNTGKGAAVRAGMQVASGERRAFVDADGAVPFAEIAQLDAALAAGADVAVGSRVLDPSRVDALLHRKLIGWVFRCGVRLLLVRSVEDTQCGFKLFRASAAETLFADQRIPGYGFDLEVLARAERSGMRVAEIPVRWRERPGSKVRLVQDSFTMALDLFRLRLSLGRPGPNATATRAATDQADRPGSNPVALR